MFSQTNKVSVTNLHCLIFLCFRWKHFPALEKLFGRLSIHNENWGFWNSLNTHITAGTQNNSLSTLNLFIQPFIWSPSNFYWKYIVSELIQLKGRVEKEKKNGTEQPNLIWMDIIWSCINSSLDKYRINASFQLYWTFFFPDIDYFIYFCFSFHFSSYRIVVTRYWSKTREMDKVGETVLVVGTYSYAFRFEIKLSEICGKVCLVIEWKI